MRRETRRIGIDQKKAVEVYSFDPEEVREFMEENKIRRNRCMEQTDFLSTQNDVNNFVTFVSRMPLEDFLADLNGIFDTGETRGQCVGELLVLRRKAEALLRLKMEVGRGI